MGYDTENGRSLWEIPDKSPTSGQRKRKLLLEIEKKESRKLKSFQKVVE